MILIPKRYLRFWPTDSHAGQEVKLPASHLSGTPEDLVATGRKCRGERMKTKRKRTRSTLKISFFVLGPGYKHYNKSLSVPFFLRCQKNSFATRHYTRDCHWSQGLFRLLCRLCRDPQLPPKCTALLVTHWHIIRNFRLCRWGVDGLPRRTPSCKVRFLYKSTEHGFSLRCLCDVDVALWCRRRSRLL